MLFDNYGLTKIEFLFYVVNYKDKKTLFMKVDGARGRGIPKKRWIGSVRNDLEEKGLDGTEFMDRKD